MSRWVLIAICLVALTVKADGPPDALTAGVAEFRAAYQAWDVARFVAAAEMFRQTTTNEAASVTNFYWLGVARFHRLLHLQHAPGSETNNAAAAAALDAAIEAMAAAVKWDEHHAESHALLGTLYGMKINDGLLRAVRFGPRVAKHRQKALEFGAANPRVQYLLGMCQFHTAKKEAAWREALATLLGAEKLFTAEAKVSPGPLDPRWGRDSCLTFIGRSCELLGQADQAGEYYRKALTLHPADHVAKAGLQRVERKK